MVITNDAILVLNDYRKQLYTLRIPILFISYFYLCSLLFYLNCDSMAYFFTILISTPMFGKLCLKNNLLSGVTKLNIIF